MSIDDKNNWLYLEYGLFKSKAFRELTRAAIDILFEFYMVAPKKKVNGFKGKEWIRPYNGKIEFTYKQAKEKFGYSKTTCSKCIDQLIDRGFLELTHKGGGMEGDKNKYAILENWKRYGRKDFIKKDRERGFRKIGFMK